MNHEIRFRMPEDREGITQDLRHWNDLSPKKTRVIVQRLMATVEWLEWQIESYGFRRCDDPACNCGGHHPPEPEGDSK